EAVPPEEENPPLVVADDHADGGAREAHHVVVEPLSVRKLDVGEADVEPVARVDRALAVDAPPRHRVWLLSKSSSQPPSMDCSSSRARRCAWSASTSAQSSASLRSSDASASSRAAMSSSSCSSSLGRGATVFACCLVPPALAFGLCLGVAGACGSEPAAREARSSRRCA